MPKQEFSFEKGGPKRLVLSWKGVWKDFTITLDGQEIGKMNGQKELKQGGEYTLPDGSNLKVHLVQKYSGAELQILKDGEPLPGSASDPEQKFKVAYGIIFFIAGLNLLIGLLGLVFQSDFFFEMGWGLYQMIFGLVFLGLGFWARTKSSIALIIATAIFALDALLIFFSGGFNFAWILIRVLLIIPMYQGIGAVKQLED